MATSPLLFVICSSILVAVIAKYEPTWESLDSRPLPQWYDDAKIGIFIHWGVFAVPSFGSEWFWEFWKKGKLPAYVSFMEENYPPGFTYQDFAPQFTAEFFDPEEWTRFSTPPGLSTSSLPANITKVLLFGLRRIHGTGTAWMLGRRGTWLVTWPALESKAPHIHFGLYHSLFEWFNPLYLQDKANYFHTNDFVATKTLPELYDIVRNYEPEIIWSDGEAEAHDWYWNATVFLAWLFNNSPVKDTVVVNDRWGIGTPCKHGSFYTCADRYNPGTVQPHKWENCMTLDKKSWGYRRNAVLADYLTIHELITQLAETVSCGGNILINIGPTHDGRLPPIMEERLRQLGTWLGINGGAIYGSRPWVHQNDSVTPGVWYTAKEDVTYAIVLNWPKKSSLLLASVEPTEQTKIFMFGYGDFLEEELKFKSTKSGMVIKFPEMGEVRSQWAWVLIMTDIIPAAPRR
ncbi:plasma alpha-L-fucosidase-like [Macrobrachium nipponense]|uniref:plasma alpha-L-fucosidase-like n=1 Tax=Macrobrachium nipponense TaxID=159736 RepID=UPI0030C7FAAD